MYAQDNNSLPVWIILSPAHHHISINSQLFLVGIVSQGLRGAGGTLRILLHGPRASDHSLQEPPNRRVGLGWQGAWVWWGRHAWQPHRTDGGAR